MKKKLAIIDKLYEYKSLTPSQHKIISISFKLMYIVLKLGERLEVNTSFFNCGYSQCILASIREVETPMTETTFDIAREDSLFSRKNSNLELIFDAVRCGKD